MIILIHKGKEVAAGAAIIKVGKDRKPLLT